MESKTQIDDIPTALPGSEDEDAREKLLLETVTTDSDIEDDEEPLRLAEENGAPKRRGWKVMGTVAGFMIFVGILAFALSWFFGMGWFAETKPQPVSRNASKETQTAPVTEDEKLKMALSMIAVNDSKANGVSEPQTIDSDERSSAAGTSVLDSEPLGSALNASDVSTKETAKRERPYALASSVDAPTLNITAPTRTKNELITTATSQTRSSGDTPGRSVFFGVTKSSTERAISKSAENTALPISINDSAGKGIPFGTLLPVRVIGSIYTFRGSGGFVRMELTRPVEGNGFSYPAGTKVIGNVRGGESSRAFVTIIGLIDPVSGDLVKFAGELLGADGASGIEGKRRRLTRQWARFFNGLKETASSVLGSVGALRSGGTVILSEPLRRGSESMSEDFSGALLNGSKENTFIEVSAGSNGYVLVTDLPETSPAPANKSRSEAKK